MLQCYCGIAGQGAPPLDCSATPDAGSCCAAARARCRGQASKGNPGLLALALPSTQHSRVQMVCFLQGKVTQALTRLALGVSPGIVDHVPALYDEFFALQLCSPPRDGSSQPHSIDNAGAGYDKSASPAWPG